MRMIRDVLRLLAAGLSKHYSGRVHWLGAEKVRSLTVGDLLTVSTRDYATVLGMPRPPDRSLLAAIKRMPGVEVRPDLRGLCADGSKTTTYTIRPVELGGSVGRQRRTHSWRFCSTVATCCLSPPVCVPDLATFSITPPPIAPE